MVNYFTIFLSLSEYDIMVRPNSLIWSPSEKWARTFEVDGVIMYKEIYDNLKTIFKNIFPDRYG